MRCKNCGWVNNEDSIACEKCHSSMLEHANQNTKTINSGLKASNSSSNIYVRCSNGHFYNSSIYGNSCPYCSATSHIQSSTVSEGKCFTRPLQERHTFQESPVVGFLFSISRRGITEYWTLHIGRNTIGRSNDNDIILSENSVSSSHAVIDILRTNELKVFVWDAGSSKGTIINGVLINFNSRECNNGDIIEIGNYQLYLIIIDSDKIGLKVSDKFVYDVGIRSKTVSCSYSDSHSDSQSSGRTCIRKTGEPSIKGSEEYLSHEDNLRKRREKLRRELLEGNPEAIAHTKESVTNNSGIMIPSGKLSGEPNIITDTFEPNVHRTESASSIWGRLFKRRKSSYEVFNSIFAPSEVKRKSRMMVQVYLHLYEETEKVKALAQESDKDAERRDYIPLQCKLKEGDKVDVQLNIYGETLLMSEKKSVIWQGSFTKCSFDYFVPKDIDADELSCVALLTVNNIPVGEMRFITKIVENPRQLNPEIIAHRFSKVFVSYSHVDEPKVKFLHEGLELGRVPHFFDRKYLKTGDVFPQVIQDYINSADLFVLCWSENAA